MIIRIEFVKESDRKDLLHNLSKFYDIVEESKIYDSKIEKSKKKLQFIELMKK